MAHSTPILEHLSDSVALARSNEDQHDALHAVIVDKQLFFIDFVSIARLLLKDQHRICQVSFTILGHRLLRIVVVAMTRDVQDVGFLAHSFLEVLISSEHLLELYTISGALNCVLDALALAIEVQQLDLIISFVCAFDPLGRGMHECNIDAARV